MDEKVLCPQPKIIDEKIVDWIQGTAQVLEEGIGRDGGLVLWHVMLKSFYLVCFT